MDSKKKETAKLKIENEVLRALRETLEGSSVHSFPNMVRNKYCPVKIMWVVCLLISLSYCIYSVVQTIQDFLEFEVISVTKENFINPLAFPVITICNINFFSSNVSNKIMSNIFNNSLDQEFSDISPKLSFYFNRYSYILNANYLNESIRQQLGYDLNQIMVSCIFNYQDCNLEKDFVYYFDPMYGNCFKFNSDNTKFISYSGSMNGLQLELYTDPVFKNENLFAINNGFYIFINNQSSFASYYHDGLAIPLGQLTNVLLNKFTIIKQPIPYSNCIQNLLTINSYSSRSFKETLRANKFYHRDDCLNMCYQLYLGDKCGCYDLVSGPFPTKLRPCLNSSDQVCNNVIWADFLTKNLLNYCDCPYECEKTSYTYSTSFSQYPTRSYGDFLLKQPKVLEKFSNQSEADYDNLRMRVASVNIFYNEMKETLIVEDKKLKLIDIISNVGGILGLFLGMSFLSFMEIFEIIFQTISILLRKRFRNFKLFFIFKANNMNDNQKFSGYEHGKF